MNRNYIIGTLVGGVVYFLLGFLIYGMLLSSLMEENMNSCAMRSPEDFIYWAIIVSNFIWAYFLTMVFEWADIKGFGSGMTKGLILGVLLMLGFDIGMYASMNLFNNMSALCMDVVIGTLMSGVVGGVIGWIRMGKNSKSE